MEFSISVWLSNQCLQFELIASFVKLTKGIFDCHLAPTWNVLYSNLFLRLGTISFLRVCSIPFQHFTMELESFNSKIHLSFATTHLNSVNESMRKAQYLDTLSDDISYVISFEWI